MDRWVEETIHNGFRVHLKATRVHYDIETEHWKLIIFDNPDFGKVMMLDNVVQLTSLDEFVYHETHAHISLFAHGDARNVLIVGGGDGGVLREVLKHRSVETAVLCEIDRTVIDLALEHFPEISNGAFDDPRTEIVIADGTAFVKETDRRFEVIIVDSTDPIGPGAALFTPEFYADCKRCLSPGGLLITQQGLVAVQPWEVKQSIAIFRELFADASAFVSTIPSYFGGPMVFSFTTDDPSLRRRGVEEIRKRYEAAGAFETKYWTPELHVASFALPAYIGRLVEG
jgi:spermidine synthase